jgi:hypothetical protein
MSEFYLNGPVWCPNCEPRFNKHGERVGEHLACMVRNYSGCAVDFGSCQECDKRFQVSYKVDEITEIQ